MTPSPSYNPKACCGAHCFRWPDHESGPCWGDVEVIDDTTTADSSWEEEGWVHACQGHRYQWDDHEAPYIPEPPQPPPKGTFARAIWDARGGPPPPPLMQGFA